MSAIETGGQERACGRRRPCVRSPCSPRARGRWWPRSHHLGSTALVDVVLEPETGGRLYSHHEGGQQIVFGHVLAWEPPERLCFSWEISADWKLDAALASQVEVRFMPAGSDTRVELIHSHFEVLGPEAGARMRADVEGGWPALLKSFFDFVLQHPG